MRARWLFLLDLITYTLIRGLYFAFGLIPQEVRVALFAALWRVAIALIPRLGKTAETNIKLAFPDKDTAWRRELLRKNCREMGRLLADAVRLSKLDAAWVREHVEIPALPRYAEVSKDRGILIATGHLGSFELLGHAIGLWGYPLSAIARSFKSRRLNDWWTSLRQSSGNSIIDRKGAFKEILLANAKGRSVAVLFDQNVKINHAVFVDWFGLPAATTRAFALAAIKLKAPVFVAGMLYLGNDRYRVQAVECDFSKVYESDALSDTQKVELITDSVSQHYCQMIREFPEGWFWIHRRWKTRPQGEECRG